MIEDKQLESLLGLPAEERLKLARILIKSAAEDGLGDLSNQMADEKVGGTKGLLSLAGRYAGGPGNTAERAEQILESDIDTLTGLGVR